MVKLKNMNIIIYLFINIIQRLSKFYISVKKNSEHFGALSGFFYKRKHGTEILGTPHLKK